MRYGLTRRLLGFQGFVEISEEEYAAARTAKVNLQTLLRIEEKFDLLLANYVDLERDLLDITLRRMVYRQPGWSSAMDDLAVANRRVANLLTALRAYVDQVPRELGKAIGAAGREEFKKGLSDAHERVPGYRILCAVRNHAQHRAMPLHGIAYRSSREDAAGEARFRERAVPWIDPARLAEDRGLRAAVLEELRQMGGQVDLMPLARSCVEALAGVHGRMRELSTPSTQVWERVISVMFTRGREVLGEDVDVSLVREGDSGAIDEVTALLPEQIERLRAFREKNARLSHLSERYVSGS